MARKLEIMNINLGEMASRVVTLFKGLGRIVIECLYGENGSQQPAGFFSYETNDPLAIGKFTLEYGNTASFNNLCDLHRLIETTTRIAAGYVKNGSLVPCIALGVKHGNCCGAYVTYAPIERTGRMMDGDPLAIFGGLVMTNFTVNEEDTQGLSKNKLDGVIAPRFDTGVFDTLQRAKGKCRFLANPALESLTIESLDSIPRVRQVRGGVLLQPANKFILDWGDPDLKVYGDLTPRQKKDLILAWAIGSSSNSNTITLVKDDTLLANAVGQQDRVGAAYLAIWRAQRSKHSLEGAVAYSDSFFPFPDGVELLIKAGIKAIYTSSGSMNDDKTIALCKEHGVVLCMIPDAKGRGFFGH